MLCKHTLEVILLMHLLQEESWWNFSIIFVQKAKFGSKDMGAEIILLTIK